MMIVAGDHVQVRSPATITTMLSAVYAEPRTVGDQLPRSIRQASP